MVFHAMWHPVIPEQKVTQPSIRFLLGFRLMKVVECFVHLFDRPKRSLHLAFRAGRGMARSLTARQMCTEFNVEVPEDLLEYAAAGNRPIIHV
jgi:hypothetical protein